MRHILATLAIVLFLTGSCLAAEPGSTAYLQQIQVPDKTWEIDMQLLTPYDIHITNAGHCTVYVSNYYFDHYSGFQDADPNIPGRVMWTLILPGDSLDVKDIYGPFFAVCAKGQSARIGITIKVRN